MDVNYPGLRDDAVALLKQRELQANGDGKAKVYFGELIEAVAPRFNITLKKNTPRFNGDFAIRQCLYVILRDNGWSRVGTKKQVQNPVFEKVVA